MDFFTRLAERALDQAPVIAAVVPSLFAPTTGARSDDATFEQTEPLAEATRPVAGNFGYAGPGELPPAKNVSAENAERRETTPPSIRSSTAESTVRVVTRETVVPPESAFSPRPPATLRDEPATNRPALHLAAPPPPAFPPRATLPNTPPTFAAAPKLVPDRLDTASPASPAAHAPRLDLRSPDDASSASARVRVVEEVKERRQPVLNLPATPSPPRRSEASPPGRGQNAEAPRRSEMRMVPPTPSPERAAPSVQVRIGRVDVRAVMSGPPAQPSRRAPAGPKLSLDDYLGAKTGGSR